MAFIRCKMCGGRLDVDEGVVVTNCQSCGTRQTVPSVEDEKKIKLFERANTVRMSCEFDRALGVYKEIAQSYSEEAEAYWGILLCKYGIEYVDDPESNKKIPLCHRPSLDSIFDEDSFDKVMENADVAARGVYREEAKRIEELRRGIVEKASKEESCDIFICHKEKGDSGERTNDSLVAEEIYEALTKEGYRVYLSRVALENRESCDFEPVIFSSLCSARVMLAIGTSYDNFHDVWVKNEWTRYLRLIEKGEAKVIIPCFKDLDVYDMPKEFKHLQAQDMGKTGAMQELLQAVEEALKEKKEEPSVQPVQEVQPVQAAQKFQEAQPVQNSFVTATLTRAKFLLKDFQYSKADQLYEKVLESDPTNEDALLGKVLVKEKCTSLNNMLNPERTGFLSHNISPEYRTLMLYCSQELKQRLEEGVDMLVERCVKIAEECVKKGIFEDKDKKDSSDFYATLFVKIILGERPNHERGWILALLIDFREKSLEDLINSGKDFKSSKTYEKLISICSEETRDLLEGNSTSKEDRVILKGQDYLNARDFDNANKCFEQILSYLPNYGDALIGKLLVEFEAKNLDELLDGSKKIENSPTYKKIMEVCSPETKELFETVTSREDAAKEEPRCEKAIKEENTQEEPACKAPVAKTSCERSKLSDEKRDSIIMKGQQYLSARDFNQAKDCFEEVLAILPDCEDALIGRLLVEYRAQDLDHLFDGTKIFTYSFTYKKLKEIFTPETKEMFEGELARIREAFFNEGNRLFELNNYKAAAENYKKFIAFLG